ncbi:GNAT family N-acetyltransferase [Cohnella zeiphila]|uniref:GNAT family N-acetyltransferase n=1 Tax=Cohnella zeiphila TaxID=2761120 RepID=A0A7X0SK36_9BACL|nr:GNAT family protein [Cohnella zeiphila]MBB6730274.1 GNAT family N-acetyltransferase [Cohnella zeiphila]
MPYIIGEKIMLREYRLEDLVPIRAWVNDPEVVESLSDIFLYPQTLESTESYLRMMMEPRPDCRGFIIADAQTQLYIGQINLDAIDWKNRVGRIGIVIGSPERFGRGYGTEAMRLLVRFAFEQMGLNRLELDVYDFNERALRCYRSCGFREEGRLRQKLFKNGHYVDIIPMGLLRSEWLEHQAASEG